MTNKKNAVAYAAALACVVIGADVAQAQQHRERRVPREIRSLPAEGAPQPLSLSLVMRRASSDFPSVHAQEAEVAAAAKDRVSNWASMGSVTGVVGVDNTNGNLRIPEQGISPVRHRAQYGWISAQVSISLSRYFRDVQLRNTQRIQESILLATRMQLAADALENYFSYVMSEVRIAWLRELIQRIERLPKIGLDPPKSQLISSLISRLNRRQDAYEKQMATALRSLEMYVRPLVPENNPNKFRRDIRQRWQRYDELIPLPPNRAEALRKLERNPPMVQAVLNRKNSESQWYINLADALTPQIGVAIQHYRGGLTFLDPAGGRANVTIMRVEATWTITGALSSNLDAARLREWGAHQSVLAVKATTEKNFDNAYFQDAYYRDLIEEAEEQIRDDFAVLASLRQITSKDVDTIVALANSVDDHMAALAEAVPNLYANRFSANTMLGELDSVIDQIEAIENASR